MIGRQLGCLRSRLLIESPFPMVGYSIQVLCISIQVADRQTVSPKYCVYTCFATSQKADSSDVTSFSTTKTYLTIDMMLPFVVSLLNRLRLFKGGNNLPRPRSSSSE